MFLRKIEQLRGPVLRVKQLEYLRNIQTFEGGELCS